MKKILAMMLTAAMMLSMGTAAMAADNQDATFSKTYVSKNAEANPEETFTFRYTALRITDSNNGTTEASQMPAIPDSTVTYSMGEVIGDNATTGENGEKSLKKDLTVELSKIEWPSVGVYYYSVEEVPGETLGVTYHTEPATLKITVAYDVNTDTYYTAFVTLNLVDEDGDGITDGEKTYGFTNIYEAGDLAVTKEVTGNLGDVTQDFEVTVTFTNDTGKNVNSTITYESNATATEDKETGEVKFENNTAVVTLNLKNGETVNFNNIPYGIKYTVEEANYTDTATDPAKKLGYETAKYALNGGNPSETAVTSEPLDTASESVKITNTKKTDVDTGISVDSIPYIAMLGVVAIGGTGFIVSKKRRSED